MLLMVKPQFEVGKSDVGNGVVSSPELRAQAVEQVVASAQECGLGLRCVVASDTPGPEGNVEYFVWLDKSAKSVDADTVRHLIEVAVKEGPS
jgi:23S rRNA (cytidine1920-2'-O)/16S rRNA (cytidine1409-2'-O)-methyltransferase